MKQTLLPAEKIDGLLTTLSDIILITNIQGDIQSVQINGRDLKRQDLSGWQGKNLASVASLDSQDKIRQLLSAKPDEAANAWRHVNLLSPSNVDVPLQLLPVAFEESQQLWLFGRDLSGVSQMQRRLVEAHQSMERDYLRLRHMEARYRLLFDSVAEPMLVVDVAQRRVMEANHAAQQVFKDILKRLPGSDVTQCFESSSGDALDALLRSAQTSGRTESTRLRILKADQDCELHVSVFVQEGGPQFLIRMQSGSSSSGSMLKKHSEQWFSTALENAPVGFIVSDRNGLILAANPEICAMLGLSLSSQLVDKNIEDYLERGSVDLGVLLNNLRQSRTLRGYATELRTVAGVQLAVEMSAVTLGGNEPAYGFFIRDIQLGRGRDKTATSGMADSVEQLSQLVGRMPMKDIVGETSTMIERMCIQAALELTHNNRASAAEMLGLSRQSLYIKLHRYGMVTEVDSE